jgi:CelD/BcsL family acetyltransferase involved in cellulose biosynthesis
MKLKIQSFNSFDENLKAIWLDFETTNNCYVFQTYNWVEHWYSTVGCKMQSIKPTIIVVFRDDAVVALFPFGVQIIFGIRVLVFIGGGQADYNNPILSTKLVPADFELIWGKVIEELPKCDAIDFQRIPHSVNSKDNLFLKTISATKSDVSFSTQLPDVVDKLPQLVSKRMLKDNARMVKRLSEKGDLQYVVATNISQYNEIINTALKQKERQYVSTGVRNILSNSNIYNFYRNLFENLKPDVNVHLSALIHDNEILAAHLGAVYGNRFYYLMPTYSIGKYKKYSPGRLLLEYLMKWSIENNLEVYDFTTGAEAYKNKWCNVEMPVYQKLTSKTAIGVIFVNFKKIIVWGKTTQFTRSIAINIVRYINYIRKG